MIIGFSGKMQRGKSTSSQYLVNKYGFHKFAFADPIKKACKDVFGWNGIKDELGRRLLIDVGKAGRRYDPLIWVKLTFSAIDREFLTPSRENITIDDVRFPNEIEYIKNRGGEVIRINGPQRGGTEDIFANNDISETALDNYQFNNSIDNSLDLNNLYGQIDKIYDKLILEV